MHVLIVDDHPLYIRGVEALLFELDPALRTTGAGSVSEAVDIAQRTPVDLMLLDLKLPGMTGLLALRTVRAQFQELPVVVVSASEDPHEIALAIELGAAGYIPKNVDQAQVIHALNVVLARGVYLPPCAVNASNGTHEPGPALSERQIVVLQRLLQGKSNKLIARDLGIAEGTVKAHLSSIYQALGVNSRLGAMRKAHELRLIDRFPKPG